AFDTGTAILRLRPADPEALEARAFLNSRVQAESSMEALCLRDHEGWIRSIALAPDGRHALSGGDDTIVRLWDLTQGRELRCLTGHTGPVMSVTLTADGRRALTGSWDGTMRLWDLQTGKELRSFSGQWKAIKS